MRMKSLAGTVGLLVLIGGAVYFGIKEAGDYVSRNTQKAIVSIGSAATGEKVTLDDFNINLLTGSASLKNLLVPNSGIGSAKYSFSVETAKITISPWSLFWGPVHIKSIEISAPAIDLETSATSSNLAVIVLAAGAYAATADKSSDKEKKLRVDNLTVTGAKLSGKLYPLSTSYSTTLSTITMGGLGATGDGMTQADFINSLLTNVVNQATTAALHL